MIISRFGSTWAAAYQLGTLKGEDDYQTQRPASVGQVGGMSGAFDFWGSTANPLGAQVVNKKYEIAAPFLYTAGTGTVYVLDVDGENFLIGVGVDFTTLFAPGDYIRFTYSATTYNMHVIEVATSSLRVDDPSSLPAIAIGSAVSYEVGKYRRTYAAIQTELDALKLATVGAGESKLWAALRDGSTHRWAWAKCNRLRAPENYNTKLHLPVELEFNCREGLWYAETQSTSGNITQATSSPYALTNNGTFPAMCIFTITPSGGAFSACTVTNTTNGYTFTYTGTVASGKALVVNSGVWSVTNDGAGAYSGLAYGATQQNWMYLSPGANSFTISKTGAATGWTATLTWWNTYL
jgi:hypothetical protein